MNLPQQRICTFGGIALVAFLFVGLFCAGWLPPPAPGQTADEVARMYAENRTGIRFGAILIALAGCMQGLFVTAISVQLARIEGRRTPMAWVQLGFGYLGVLLFMIPAFCWQTAAYRPERDPEVTQLLHDFGWIPFISAVIPAILQNAAIGITVFRQRVQIFPRWLGYLNFYVAMFYVPSAFVMFFTNGPLAWNGVIAFWVLAVDFSIWVGVMTVLLLRAIRTEEPENTGTSESDRAAGFATA